MPSRWFPILETALRDTGISYGDDVEQIACALFLKMDARRVAMVGELLAILAG